MNDFKKLESRMQAIVRAQSDDHLDHVPPYPLTLPEVMLELIRELEIINKRVRALEDAAGFERPSKEKVRDPGHDYTQERE